jgi:redox-sensing transcriptional repressor
LYSQICNILGLTKLYRTVLIGAGNIGQAIANYTRFDKLGFGMKAIFDINPKLIGIRIRDIEINDIDYLADYLKENAVDIGIICVPSNNAQKVCNILVENGVRGIWNFAPVDLIVPEDVKVEDVHLSDSLLTLSCLLNDIESSDS